MAFNVRKISSFREIDYFQLKSALASYANPHAKIRQLLAKGALIRVKKGLYVLGEDYTEQPITLEVLANLIYGPSAISLEYALFHYGLIPERVQAVTSITPKRNKQFDTPVGRFTYQYLPMGKYRSGLTRLTLADKRHVMFATPEKALIDKIYLSKSLSLETDNDIEVYLFSDLRLDEQQLHKLDINMFSEIALVYNNNNVKLVNDYLKR